jgi:hypothetical protein
VTAKAFKLLGMLRRSLTGTRRAALRTAYLTLVRPILLYATPAWHPVSVVNLTKLERVQGCATRLVLGRESYYFVNGVKRKYGKDSRNLMCQMPSIGDALYRQDMIFLHKCMLGAVDLPIFGTNRVSVRSRQRRLRGGDSTQLVVPNVAAAYYNTSFFPRSVLNYNKLSDAVRSLNVSCFKSKI